MNHQSIGIENIAKKLNDGFIPIMQYLDSYTKVYTFERMKVIQYGLDSMRLNKETYKIVGIHDDYSFLLDNDATVIIYGNTMLYQHNGNTQIYKNWKQ
jgi:hypothetical protein